MSKRSSSLKFVRRTLTCMLTGIVAIAGFAFVSEQPALAQCVAGAGCVVFTDDGGASANNASSVSFSNLEVTTDGLNQVITVLVSIRVSPGTGTPAQSSPIVDTIHWNPTATGIDEDFTFIDAKENNASPKSCRVEAWIILLPTKGTGTITVNLKSNDGGTATADVAAGGIAAAGVDTSSISNAVASSVFSFDLSEQASANFVTTQPSSRLCVGVVAVEGHLNVTSAGLHTESWDGSTTGTNPITGAGGHRRGGGVGGSPFAWDIFDSGAAPAVTQWVAGVVSLRPITRASVSLERFSAAVTSADSTSGRVAGVALSWRSGGEANSLGFRVYRERDGARVQLSRDIVAGSGLFTSSQLSSGYRYGFFDRDGRTGDAYFLEDIDFAGAGSLHGPVVASGAAKSADVITSPYISDLAGSGTTSSRMVWANESVKANGKGGGSAPGGGGGNAQWQLANSPSVKIGVRDTGWYRVTPQTLATAGINLGSIDPRSLRIYNGGREIPIRVSGESDGRFDAGDSIEFFNSAIDVQSTDIQVYWLTAVAGTGQRLKVQTTHVTSGGALSYPAVAELKERFVYFASLTNGERENFFGQVVTSEPADHTLTLANLDPAGTGGTVEVSVQGVTAVPHRVSVLVNGQSVGEVAFAGKGAGFARLAVPQSALAEGANVVSLVNAPGSSPTSVSLVDTVRLGYTHRAVADQNVAVVNITGRSGARTIDGFSNGQIRAYDVTNPSAVQEIVGSIARTASGYGITLQPGATARRLLVLTPDQSLEPVSITANRPSSWNARTNGADVVYIAHRDFAASLAPLKALRESQGYRVAVVDVEDLFDEFSFGVESPAAIRAFVAQARSTWSIKPTFVTIVGDGSLDPKNYLGAGDFTFVPSKLIDTSSIEFASDDWLVDGNGDDLPDVAVGRLPVRSTVEAAALVAKIIAYESTGTVNKSALLVSDVNDIWEFSETTAAVHALIPSEYVVEQVSRAVSGDLPARQLVLSSANAGPGIVSFSGHGSIDTWRGGLLSADDAALLSNSGRSSVYVMGNCLNGYYQDPLLESLGEALLKAPNGAVAVWASSGATDPELQQALVLEFYRKLFSGQPITLGQAAAQAKLAATGDVRRSWVLLGDSVTRLH
jgi:hypothetical protein